MLRVCLLRSRSLTKLHLMKVFCIVPIWHLTPQRFSLFWPLKSLIYVVQAGCRISSKLLFNPRPSSSSLSGYQLWCVSWSIIYPQFQRSFQHNEFSKVATFNMEKSYLIWTRNILLWFCRVTKQVLIERLSCILVPSCLRASRCPLSKTSSN